MQCQSCGIEIKKHTNICPTCGETVTTLPTSLIASQGNTTSIESSFLNQLSPSTVSAGANVKLNNGKPNNDLLNSLALNNMINENSAFTKETTPPTEVLSPEKLCRRCHNELKVGAKFCSVCGTTSGPSKWEQLAKSLQIVTKDNFQVVKTNLSKINLSIVTIGFLLLSSFCLLAAIFQYLIPISVDATSLSPLIYLLRSIQFLLMALIFVVAGLIFNRR